MARRTDTAVRSRWAVSAAYAAQGLGYAIVVTTLPLLKEREGLDDAAVSLVVLLVCATAAAGSVLSDLVAARWGSRFALCGGLIGQAAAVVVIGTDAGLPVFVVAFGLYGLGLGAVDASAAMQGVLVQRRHGRDLMGGFFAWYTAAAIAGALAVAAAGSTGLGAWALAVAVVVSALVGVSGLRAWDPSRAAAAPGARDRSPLPRRGIWLFGFVILAAFTLDSAVSTWSTVYLDDGLRAAAAIAPLGYAAYQAAILVTRLATDRAVGRWGPGAVATAGAAASLVGLIVVAGLPFVAAAVVGFALAGVAVGVLVPLAFTSAGELDPQRSDEIIARVNLFNYVGAVLGAVLLGLLSGGDGLQLGFLLPAALLFPVLLVVRRFRAATRADTRRAPSADGGGDAASVAR